jgi:hypothetical protein
VVKFEQGSRIESPTSFMAYNWLVDLSFTSETTPKAPDNGGAQMGAEWAYCYLLTMANRLELDKRTDIHLCSEVAKIFSLILAPPRSEDFLLAFRELHLHHIPFHRETALFARG